MSSTPKVIRRNGGSCVCPDVLRRIEDRSYEDAVCRYGHCYVARCLFCTGMVWGEGPVLCRCDPKDRAVYHPGMAPPGHWDWDRDDFIPARAAVKPSVLRRRNRRHVRTR